MLPQDPPSSTSFASPGPCRREASQGVLAGRMEAGRQGGCQPLLFGLGRPSSSQALSPASYFCRSRFCPLTRAGSAANGKNMVDFGTRWALFERSSAIYLLRSKFLSLSKALDRREAKPALQVVSGPWPSPRSLQRQGNGGRYYYCLCSVFRHFYIGQESGFAFWISSLTGRCRLLVESADLGER